MNLLAGKIKVRKTREFWRCQNMLAFSSPSIFGEIQPQQGINMPRDGQRPMCKPTASLERQVRGPSCKSQMTSWFSKGTLREQVLLFPHLLFQAALLQHLLGSCTSLPRCRQLFSSCLWLCSPATSAPSPDAAWEHPQALHRGHP